ncbi:NAD(P)-dependent oxidoreductase [Micromonospora purpureochromogenes]|uniref:NAD-dependent epimerase/dehydratase family protein n=1 Tax=Micromonospora purpureochromogenes TaxID=47872 RepID=UPI00340C9D08
MRVLLAGASGAVGTPLTRQLIAAGHEVIGISRSQTNAERLRNAGAEAVVADVMDRENLLAALRRVRADTVIHELTALGTTNMREALQGTNNLRTTGTSNLLAAARAVGAHRFLTQSIVLGYGYRDHGPHVITEDAPFAEPVSGKLGDAIAAIRSTEEQVFSADEMEGIALRYGFFYGQDSMTGMIVNLLRKRRLPVPSSGGFANFIYLEDAAAATVAALEKGRAGQAYNIVDDEPVRWGDYLDTLAAELGARRPWRVPSWLLRPIPYVHAMMTTSMRVSNAKAKRELGWAPAVPTYREGIPLVAKVSR